MNSFIDKIEEFKEFKYLNYSKKMSSEESRVFVIRGTGIFLRVTKQYLNPFDPEGPISYSLQWIIKLKKYQYKNGRERERDKYHKLKFEEVLDYKGISDNARQELLFNLDIFTKSKGAKC